MKSQHGTSPMTTQPNVILIVLDACRLDYAKEHAPTLYSLGEQGSWFENAIAPATWTLPSHASVFTGEYPHEHGVTQPSRKTIPTPLVKQFVDHGYSTYGVSGNGFVSPKWGFDRSFNEFRYTMTPEPFLDGMDTDTYLRQHVEERSTTQLLGVTLRACLSHDRPLKSLMNFASVGVNVLSRNYLPQLTRIPYGPFAPNLQQSYSPEKNTKLLIEFIKTKAASDRPFFAFANYMDTHRPYQASPELQEKHLGRRLPKAEFERLNFDVAPPWEFVRLVQNDTVDDTDIKTLRKLYAASVESVDRHLKRLLTQLESEGIREETMIVVLGDHGENLGEMDDMGRQRFGHEASISDPLARVPLVVDHPAVTADVDEYISIKQLYGLLTAASNPEKSLDAREITRQTADKVLCEYPALGDRGFYEQYPNIDRSYLRHRVDLDSVAAYRGNWRVIVESDGTEIAFHQGNRMESEDAPPALWDAARDACEQLSAISGADTSPETTARLKELGYL